MDIPINYLAVLVAAIAYMAIGALWYSPYLLGKRWQKLMGWGEKMPEANQKAMMKSYGLMFVGSLIGSYVLAHFVYIAAVVTLADALTLGFWIWLGFQAPILVGSVLWEMKSWQLFFINAAYQLLAILVGSSILTYWV